jgi:hypothetical protein
MQAEDDVHTLTDGIVGHGLEMNLLCTAVKLRARNFSPSGVS